MEKSDVFKKLERYNLGLVTIKVRCNVCGNSWGISVDGDIPISRFHCMDCRDKELDDKSDNTSGK